MKSSWRITLLSPLFALAIPFGAPRTARCDSLWKPESDSMFTDQKARKVGDLVTIVITESLSTSQQTTRSSSKADSVGTNKGSGPLLSLLPALAFSGTSSLDAKGATSNTNSISAKLTAKIVEAKPDGTLKVEGERNISVNKDVQILKITGSIRQKDIATDNTVQSTNVADAKIDITGKGSIAQNQKTGIITRLLREFF